MTRKIADIEVLRGLAVLFVCVEHMHMNLFAWPAGPVHALLFGWTGMWSGVDLFFVISGFVIARDLVPRLASADTLHERLVTTFSFWIRRAWRLTPSAWLWLAVILVACVFFDTSGAWGSLRANLEGAISAVFNVANLRAMLTYGKFESGATFPYWSLSLEEQFYLLLPFVIGLSGKRLPLVLAVVVALQLVIPRTPLGQIFRSDALALGVLIAICATRELHGLMEPRFLARPAARWLFLLVLAGALMFAGGEDMHIPVPISLVAFISALLVLAASYDRDYIMASGWIRTLMIWVGSRSYAIYLVHVPAYFATREIWFRIEPSGTVFGAHYLPLFVTTAVTLIVVAAELNYRFVEVPLRRRGALIASEYQRTRSLAAPVTAANT
jgi:peptidoglycan/LPS O-acetylase OafA/YrhL